LGVVAAFCVSSVAPVQVHNDGKRAAQSYNGEQDAHPVSLRFAYFFTLLLHLSTHRTIAPLITVAELVAAVHNNHQSDMGIASANAKANTTTTFSRKVSSLTVRPLSH
jgi:hypothetical protein